MTHPDKMSWCGRPTSSGMVLIIVLTCLALLTILIVSFMTGASSELTASKHFSVSAETQNLAASGLNLAMGQVAGGAKADSNSISWASQPGMIRNYDATGTEAIALYKLYSSSTMVVRGQDAAAFDPAVEAPPGDWDTKPARFTDLNAPTGSGTDMRFPIVDPRASAGTHKVDGFSYAQSINGVRAATSGTDASARLPMPVEWLYELKDGSFVAATSTDGKTAVVTGASKTNPIVGRVAFWTDDESCKVNINTASEGSFWDVPNSNFSFEENLNRNWPIQNEFQRYPGHPATTSLSTVFPWLKGTSPFGAAPTNNDTFYKIAPRIQKGGSQEGTVATLASDPPASLDADRLYDSVDELAFDASRSLLAGVSEQELIQRRFFLTAQSRSPELTLFNTPRIAIWPLATRASRRGPAENLIAQAASFGPGPSQQFYFTRYNPWSSSDDFLDADPAANRSGRNRSLFSYLQAETSMAIPGWGGASFQSKWTTPERNQILMEVYDYVRSTLNLQGNMNPDLISYTGLFTGKGGVVYPTMIAAGVGSGTKGFGRFPTLQEAALIFGKDADGKVWPAIVFQLFLPTQGFKLFNPSVAVTASGLESFTWNSSAGTNRPMFLNATKTFLARTHPGGFGCSSLTGTYPIGLLHLNLNSGGANTGNVITADPSGIPIDNASPTFDFNGGTVTVTLDLSPTSGGGWTIPSGASYSIPSSQRQSFMITFPPIPAIPNPTVGATGFETMAQRANQPGSDPNASDCLIQSGDIVKSMVLKNGDPRIAAGTQSSSNLFEPHRDYLTSLKAHSLLNNIKQGNDNLVYYSSGAGLGTLVNGISPKVRADIPAGTSSTSALNIKSLPGDWDTGYGNAPDGAFINKPDEGLDYIVGSPHSTYLAANLSGINAPPQSVYFGPMRQISSPVMFGSLPTGVTRQQPWQTLLFCPNPAAGFDASRHAGFATPPDYLLLDLFWMPVTEPYAISDRASTAGKINMNYGIVPFHYITRNTGMKAILSNQYLTAISDANAADYKVTSSSILSARTPGTCRYLIDSDKTLAQFDTRFSSGKIFKSPSEICSLFLVPQGSSLASVSNSSGGFWSDKRLTGDNMRERPYNALYPRLTTQSNVYTVYVKSQSLKQTPSTLASAPATFTEGKDIVQGELQASYTFERYINPNAVSASNDTDPLGSQYNLRVINQRNLSY